MKRFDLVESLRIHVSGEVPEAVRLAAEDLARDIAAVTGGAVAPQVVEEVAARDGIVVRVVPEEFPPDAVESCRLHSEAGNLLYVEGSDARGAIYGVYAFSRKWLHVTPDYLWTQVPVRRLADWIWPEIRHEVASPTVRYRGVFINDEDLLTGWEPGGARHIDYPHYQTVLSRSTVRKLAETFLRMGYNLVIPSSFVDIRNPDEEMLLEEFARRGFILTMHHVEPLGVSAFAFDNYWKARGQVREFSYFSDPEALREVWRDSIRRWAKYPEVIWQLGLRGRSDRPFWEAGKAPEGDAERAAVISGAIREQQALVRELTGDDQALCSTTLWAEGVVFNQRGLLELPSDVITVFADNCAGWRLQDDFFQSPVRPGAWYGVYCHHAVVIGTHLAQAIGAGDFHRVLTEALKTRPLCYAIFNASNVREFIHGLQATAEITAHPAEFSPEEFLRRWVAEHFSGCHEEVCACYREYFEAFEKNSRGVAYCTDGLMNARTLQALWMLRDRIRPPETGDRATYYMRLDAMHLAALGDMFPETGTLDEWLRLLERQAARFAAAHEQARRMVGGVAPQEAALLYAQLVYPSGLDLHFCECERACQLALRDYWASDFAAAKRQLGVAREALLAFERLLPQYLAGDFAHWYDRCTKVDFRKVKGLVEEVLQGLS